MYKRRRENELFQASKQRIRDYSEFPTKPLSLNCAVLAFTDNPDLGSSQISKGESEKAHKKGRAITITVEGRDCSSGGQGVK